VTAELVWRKLDGGMTQLAGVAPFPKTDYNVKSPDCVFTMSFQGTLM